MPRIMNEKFLPLVSLLFFLSCSYPKTEDRFLVQVCPLSTVGTPYKGKIKVFYTFNRPDTPITRLAFVRITDSKRMRADYSFYDSSAMLPVLIQTAETLGAHAIMIGDVDLSRFVGLDDPNRYAVASVEAFALAFARIDSPQVDSIGERERATEWYKSHMKFSEEKPLAPFREEVKYAADHGRNPGWMIGWELTTTGKAYQLEWVEGRFFACEVDSSVAPRFGFVARAERALLPKPLIDQIRQRD